jgi:hypothetical protein
MDFMSSIPEQLPVRTLRDRYLRETGYTVESYTAPRFSIKIGPWVLTVRNPGMVRYHDLHHVVSGYGTGLTGEAQVSAYELRGGCYSAIIFFLCVGAVSIGLVISPASVWRAWRDARGSSTLYSSNIPFETLLDMNIGDLRESIGIPSKGFV